MKILRSYALTVLRSLKLLVFFLFLLLLSFGCNKYKGPLPKVYVNFTIIPDDINYDLYLIGSHQYFTGGVNGIVVYRVGAGEFTAFDRACPYDWDDEERPRVSVENDKFILICEKCSTSYSILDGGRMEGPSKYPLKQYYTTYDGVRLRIHS